MIFSLYHQKIACYFQQRNEYSVANDCNDSVLYCQCASCVYSFSNLNDAMDRIIHGLYIGNIRAAKNHEQLKINSITHILSILDTENSHQIEGIKYLCICLADSPHQNIIKHIPKFGRSVTIAAAYLASVTKFNCNETLNLIRNIRQISAPNPGFYKQLLDFETYRLRQERNRIVMEYHFGLIANDEIEIQRLSSSHHPLTTSKQISDDGGLNE
ncbi:Dual specificity protein phosphatase 22 [Dermatophagoides farinae]|uniref:Dual specificity protein phosphatase 22 n=1 Tax=Dermatophagoides farinae TaxID=6954 RepID=A0A922LAE0_DERFA|nr:Dual specificity protein phosphatase 22 [Dermatophagoides farinae]